MILYLRLNRPQLIDLYIMHQLKEKDIEEYVVDPELRSKIAGIMEDVKKKILDLDSKDDER